MPALPVDLTPHQREAADLAMLLDAPGIGPRRALALAEKHGSAAAARTALGASPKPSDELQEFLATTDYDAYVQAVLDTERQGGRVVLWTDPDYPANLAAWAGRPPLLWVKGDLSALAARSLALVGRVDPTDRGVQAARLFAKCCVDEHITVISGLAKGIDGASHAGALDAGGATFAVLGHGLDYAYPKENAALYEAISQHGALITQFRTGVGPQRWTFPARNEVMCTLAQGTVIVEGAERCGSNIQAEFSFKHGRPVFLLSHNLRGEQPWATSLVERGAHVVRYFEDVLEVLDGGGAIRVPQQQTLLAQDDAEGSSAMGTKCALFDLDGVISDSRDATATALAKVAKRELGRDVTSEDIAPYVTGSPVKALEGVGVRNAYPVYKREYSREFLQAAGEIDVHASVVQQIEDLKGRGVKLGIITSQPRDRAEALLPLRVAGLFDVVLTYGDYGGKKKDGIAKALRSLGAHPSSAVFVGDSPTDVVAARQAGVASVAVAWGFSTEADLRSQTPDALAVEPDDLLDAIGAVLDLHD